MLCFFLNPLGQVAPRPAKKPQHSADQQTPDRYDHRNDSAWAELGYHGHKFIGMSRFSLDIDYILCTRWAETANIGEWTIQAPIPESLWDRQSVPGVMRWD
jgi:hypothetical protein